MTVEKTIKELNDKQLIKKDESLISKTEFLLKNYNNLLQALDDKKELLEEVKEYGIRHESASFIEYHQGNTNADHTTEFEKKEFTISKLQHEIKTAEYNLFLIEKVINRFRERDPYFEIIERKYFNKEQVQVIINELGITERTYYRNKKRIIEELAASLFISDYIKELFTGIPE